MAITNPTIQQLMESAIARQARASAGVEKTASVREEPGLYAEALGVAEGLEKVAQAIGPEQAAELQAVLGKIFGPERAQVLYQRLDEIKMRQDQMAQPAQPPQPAPMQPAPAAPPAAGVTPEAAPAMPATQPEKTAAIQRLAAMFSDDAGETEEYSQLKNLLSDFGTQE